MNVNNINTNLLDLNNANHYCKYQYPVVVVIKVRSKDGVVVVIMG